MARLRPHVTHVLRLAAVALFGALLGCHRPTPLADDAGPGVAAPLQRPAGSAEARSGSIEGRVLWRGPRPALPRLATTASVQGVCGTSVEDNSLRLDAQGGVADAVVWVDAAAEGAPAVAEESAVVLNQRGCLYWPPVLAARALGVLRIRNSDPLTHTVHGIDRGQTVFNVAMPLEQMQLIRRLPPQPGVLDIRCDVHPWMRATIRTFDHSHFTTTGPDGRFRLSGLSPGQWQLHLWHPKLAEASRAVQVAEGATASDFELGGRP